MAEPTHRFVLAPMGVEALLVDDEGNLQSWVDQSPRFDKMVSDWQIQGPRLTPLFTEAKKAWRPKPGIHLHWALPRALTHALSHAHDRAARAAGEAGDESYPYVPNRWLVQRVHWRPLHGKELGGRAPDAKLPVTVRSWVVESDAPAPSAAGSTPKHEGPVRVPDLGDRKTLCSHLGACFPLAGSSGEWKETHREFRFPLTAVGWGNPAFAAYYPASKSVLGFHDPEPPEVAKGECLAYVVVGWYSDADRDPLASAADWPARLADLRWRCASPDPPPPVRSVCYGAAVDLAWRGESGTYASTVPTSSPGPGAKYGLAVGNSAVEALSALLIDESAHEHEVETLLQAFQHGLLTSGTGTEAFAEELHQRRFSAVQGGALFAIRTKRQETPTGEPAPPPAVPAGLENDLAVLNEAAERANGWVRRLSARRRSYYAAWSIWSQKYLELGKEPEGAVAEELAHQRGLFGEARKKLKEVRETEVDPKRQALETKLLEQRPDLELAVASAPAFHAANDPTVVIAGEGLAPPPRVTLLTEREELPCRLESEVVQGWSLHVPDTKARMSVGADDLFAFQDEAGKASPAPATLESGLGGVARRLAAELLLLDPSNAEAIARRAFALAKKPAVHGMSELQAAVEAAQEAEPAAELPPAAEPAGDAAPVGLAPASPWRTRWRANPWLPLLLQWEVKWHTQYPSAAAAWKLAASWKLEEGEEELRPAGPLPREKQQTYGGWTMLSPSAAWLLKRRLEEFNEDHHDPAVSELVRRLSTPTDQSGASLQGILCQSLGGFGDRLLQLQEAFELPAINPKFLIQLDAKGDAAKVTEATLDPQVGELHPQAEAAAASDPAREHPWREPERQVYAEALAAPEPSWPLLPVRAGSLEISRLWLVDGFGQTAELDASAWETPVHPAQMRDPAEEKPGIALAPRLSQPARLRIDWQRPEAPSPGDLPQAPQVCGWVVPNHLDKSFLFYGPLGRPLGALQQSTATPEHGFFWVPVPGEGLDFYKELAGGRSQGPEEVPNQPLADLIAWLRGMGLTRGHSFFNLVDDLLAKKHSAAPGGEPLLSILVGRPLALVRANLVLEIAGDEARHWSAAKRSEPSGVEEAVFPVRLGDADDPRDGLIGWFDEQGFCATWGAGRDDPKEPLKATRELEIGVGAPKPLTLLIDPERPVAARTGILPVLRARLPASAAAPAVGIKEAYFLTAPVLGASETPQMPAPSDDFGEWSWAVRPDVTQWKQTDSIAGIDDRARFADGGQTAAEGWLRLHMNPVVILTFFQKERAERVRPESNVTLAWRLQGADRLTLARKEDKKPLLESRWPDLAYEHRVRVDETTTFVLSAADDHDNSRTKTLTVEVEAADQGGSR